MMSRSPSSSAPEVHFRVRIKRQGVAACDSDEESESETQAETNRESVSLAKEDSRGVAAIVISESKDEKSANSSSLVHLPIHSRFLYAAVLGSVGESEDDNANSSPMQHKLPVVPPTYYEQPVDILLPVDTDSTEIDQSDDTRSVDPQSQIPDDIGAGTNDSISEDENGPQEEPNHSAVSIHIPETNDLSEQRTFFPGLRKHLRNLLNVVKVSSIVGIKHDDKASSRHKQQYPSAVLPSTSITTLPVTEDTDEVFYESEEEIGSNDSQPENSADEDEASNDPSKGESRDEAQSNSGNLTIQTPEQWDETTNKSYTLATDEIEFPDLEDIGIALPGGMEDGTISILYKPPSPNTSWPSPEIESVTPPNVFLDTENWDEIDLNSDDDEWRSVGTQTQASTNSGGSPAEVPEQLEDPNPREVSVHISDSNIDFENMCDSTFHLHTYFKFMHNIGLSAYAGKEQKKRSILSTLQMVGFVLFNTLALLDALKKLKIFCLEFAIKEDLDYFVKIFQHAFHCLSAVYFIKFAAFDSNRISEMLDNLLGGKSSSDENSNSSKNSPLSQLALSIGISSLAFAMIGAVFHGIDLKDWTFAEPLFQRSFEVVYPLFVWNTENYDEKVHKIELAYSSEVSISSVCFGTFGFLVEVSGLMQHYAIRDIMLLGALIIHQLVTRFKSSIQGLNSTTANQIGEQVKKFQHLQTISGNMTNTLGILLTILHIKNMLLFTELLLKLLDPSRNQIALLLIAFQVAKTLATYVLAAKASQINQDFQKWIHKQSHDGVTNPVASIETNGVILYLDELKREQVGLGSGMSFVSWGFIMKFFGYVTSCFLFFAKKDN